MLKIKVKASSITNLTDARYFAAWGVSWMGFTLDPSSSEFMDITTANAIKEWLDGVEFVGEFGLQSAPEIETAAEAMELQAIQLGHFATTAQLPTTIEATVFKEIIVEPQTTSDQLDAVLRDFDSHADFILLDLARNNISLDKLKAGTGLSLDWLQQVAQRTNLVLAMNWSAKLLEEVLQEIPLAGISLKGGEEEKVGFKSFDELDEIFEFLEEQT
jgi:phosphoribosylanthranilate isomerase